MTEKKIYARGAYRRFLEASLSVCLLLMPLCAEGALHSFTKGRFTEDPNVLILLDTSGSMNFRLDKDESTHGDGSRPLKYGWSTYRYFGKDNYPGQNTTGNNDVRGEYNYHPNLKYIRDEDLTGITTPDRDKYFSKRTAAEPSPGPGESVYKHPNDSRMYALKNVMWRLLHDEEIYKGLKIALATYYQNEFSTPTKPKHSGTWSEYIGNWFRWKPENPPTNNTDKDLQHIYWGYMSKPATYDNALLREPFKSTNDPEHLQNLRMWFSGDGGPKDMRAIGATPLTKSIYQDKSGYSTGSGSALQFFRAPGVITDPCQSNWLIVLTDGADSQGGGTPENAVKNLHGSNMVVYGKAPAQIAQNIQVFVIGLILPTNTTLANTLHKMAEQGGSKKYKKAFLADNVKALLDALTEIFKEIQSASMGQAPLVSPPRDSEDEDGLYVVEYTPRQARQWKGSFKKMLGSEDDDGKLSYKKEWEAAEHLDDWDDRKIYTSFAGLVGKDSNLFRINASFDSGANPLLDNGTILGIANWNDRAKFIKWLCGSDEYDEEKSGEIHKLWDICNSGMVKVGAPSAPILDSLYTSFRDSYRNRNKQIYVQSNAGMLHAFDDETGDEKFAFIPPNVLFDGRLRGLRHADGSSAYSNGVASISRYLLDGPVTVEDVLIGGRYRTILLGQLGFGGAGMYALDITSASPDAVSFMWAIENDVHQYDTTNRDVRIKAAKNRKVIFWQGAEKTTHTAVEHPHEPSAGVKFDADYDYRRLRRTVGVPFIGRVFSGTSAAMSSWKWLFAMTSGTTNGVYGDYDSPGAVYLGDLSDGRIIKKFDVDSPVTSPVITLSEEHHREMKRFLVGDVSGKVHKGDLSGWKVGDWDMYPVLEFPANTSGISRSLSAAILRNIQTWVFAGTGDVSGYIQSATTDTNYFAAANISAVEKGSPLKVLNDLVELNPALGTDEFDISKNPTKKGWYLKLANGEKMASPPVYFGGLILFTTFIPDADVCSNNGDTRFYILNSVTGKSAWHPITETKNKYKQYDDKMVPGFGIHAAPEGSDYAFTVILPDGTLWPVARSSLADDIPMDRTSGELLYWRSR